MDAYQAEEDARLLHGAAIAEEADDEDEGAGRDQQKRRLFDHRRLRKLQTPQRINQQPATQHLTHDRYDQRPVIQIQRRMNREAPKKARARYIDIKWPSQVRKVL